MWVLGLCGFCEFRRICGFNGFCWFCGFCGFLVVVFFFSIHKKDRPIVELEEVRTFHASLVKHTKEIIGLNLAAVPLMMYKTPDFELYATGKVDSILFFPQII